MDQTQERRTTGEDRIPVTALVEICGNEPGIPAFEAQSVDVSRRGMHLVTSFVPQIGDPLVCRFENHGKEIVVEGVVAWADKHDEGGEFGVQFTALDSGSVQALQELCSAPSEPAPATSRAASDAVSTDEPGTKVRLHIDGLGTPMKARVRELAAGSVRVGSNLEFLRVGRRLEIEDAARTSKRAATIDSVSVTVDPQTQIPQLIVTLRYDDAQENTPEPTVIDYDAAAPGAVDFEPSETAGTVDTESSQPTTPESTAGEELAERAGQLTAGAAAWARAACGSVATYSARAAVGLSSAVKVSRSRLAEVMKNRSTAAVRRTTAAPPASAASVQGRRLRPQGGARSAEGGAKTGRVLELARRAGPRKLGISAAAIVLTVTVAAIALRGGSHEPPGATAAPSSAQSEVLADNAAAAAKAAAQSAPAPSATPGAQNGVVANVPLFGPTPMATMEPAPLGPPPEAAEAPLTDEQRERAAAADAAKDLSFAAPAKAPAADAESDEDAKPNKGEAHDVKAWGKGKMALPTVYRLRLDAAGAALSGTATATGFSVVVPERKVMESPTAILKRDRRIARIKSQNIVAGAQVTFEFRGDVPAYRVRLRKDFIEFLVSASAPSKAPSHTARQGKSGK